MEIARRRVVFGLTIAAFVAACTGSQPPSAGTPSSLPVPPSVSTPSPPAAPPSLLAIVTTSAPVSPTGCELPRHAAQSWPSDRLRAVTVDGTTVEFQFDAPSSQLSTPPTVTYGPARGSIPVAVEGSSRMAIRFEHLLGTFTGTRDLRPAGSPVKEVVAAEEGGGILTWVIGLDYPGCGSATVDPSKLVVELDFPVGGPVP